MKKHVDLLDILSNIVSMEKQNELWKAVKGIGEKNGASAWAMNKWVSRGIPSEWKIKIVRQSGGSISFDDLDGLDPLQKVAS